MTIIAQRIGNPWSETVCSPMFCHDTRPRFSITHSRTLITTNRNNQFFESIYIADLSPTDNFHLIHPPYVSIHFAIDQWKWKRKHFHKYVFVISKYLSTLFYSVLYSSITIDNSIKSNFLLYTPSWFSFHLSNHYRDLLFFSRHWEKLFNDPCVKRTVKNTVTIQKKVTVSCVHQARDRARWYEARNWPQSGDPAT